MINAAYSFVYWLGLAWLGGVALLVVGCWLLVVGLTWLLHGVFLQNLAKEFLGECLKREAEHAVSQLENDQLAIPSSLTSSSHSYQIFHHLYVLRLNGEISASEPEWQRQLSRLLNEEGNALIEVKRGERRLLVYRQHFEWLGTTGALLIGE